MPCCTAAEVWHHHNEHSCTTTWCMDDGFTAWAWGLPGLAYRAHPPPKLCDMGRGAVDWRSLLFAISTLPRPSAPQHTRRLSTNRHTCHGHSEAGGEGRGAHRSDLAVLHAAWLGVSLVPLTVRQKLVEPEIIWPLHFMVGGQ